MVDARAVTARPPTPPRDPARSAPESWEGTLARRLRTLLRAAPLFRLEAGKGHRLEDLAAHDLRALGLRAIDAAIEHMGLGHGATFDELTDALVPLILAAEPDAPADRARAIAAVVLEGLLNERARRVAFREPYTTFEAGRPVPRALSFHLLREEEAPDGRIVIRASTEGINVYAGMLEVDVEDAQAAEEAILHSQIRRGRVAQAVVTAQQTRLRSLEYEQKLLSILEAARRDVTAVDWVADVLAIIDRALDHLSDRLKVERDILEAAERRMEHADPDEAAQVVELCDVLRDCLTRHLALHARLIGANTVYLAEQDRQLFRRRPMAALPDLESAVLEPALHLSGGAVDALADALLVAHHAPEAPAVLHLPQLAALLIGPRRGSPEPDRVAPQRRLEAAGAIERRFSPADRRAVDHLLDGLDDAGRDLGDLLRDARDGGHGPGVLDLLVLRALQAAEPLSDRGGAEPIASHSTGRPLDDPDYAGDDLHVAGARS